MGLSVNIAPHGDCEGLRLTNCTTYCETEYDLDYIFPLITNPIIQRKQGTLGEDNMTVTAGTYNSDDTTIDSYTWTYTGWDRDIAIPASISKSYSGQTVTLGDLNPSTENSGQTYVNLSIAFSGNSILGSGTVEATMIVHMDSDDDISDYFISNIDVTTQDTPTINYDSNYLSKSGGSDIVISTNTLKYWNSHTPATVTAPFNAFYDYSTTSAPGLPTADQTITNALTFTVTPAVGTWSNFGKLDLRTSTGSCTDTTDLIADEINIIALTATNPAGVTDVFALGVPNFINSTYIDLELETHFSDIGSISNGIWTFNMYVTAVRDGDTLTYRQTFKQLIVCAIECKIKSLLADLAVNGDCCCNKDYEDTKSRRAILAHALVQAAKYAAKCNKESEATNIVSTLENLLVNTGCDDC